MLLMIIKQQYSLKTYMYINFAIFIFHKSLQKVVIHSDYIKFSIPKIFDQHLKKGVLEIKVWC